MTNNIRPADINDFEAVRDITQTTIREDIENLSCYPKYCRMLTGMLPVRARMIYNDFQGIRLSALGMGNMRLPIIGGDGTRGVKRQFFFLQYPPLRYFSPNGPVMIIPMMSIANEIPSVTP